MFEEINAAMQAETTDVVKLWMNWMMLIFFASIFFVRRHKAARWALAVIVATMIGAALIWHLTQNIHLFGIAHLVLWAPLAIYLWKTVLSKPARRDGQGGKPFLIWAGLLFATIMISLVFDVRDIYLVLTGGR